MQRARMKKRARRAASKAPRRARQTATAAPYHHLSHEGVMISDIISGSAGGYATPEAMEFTYLLSNLTRTMQVIIYGSGIRAGRLIYSISEHGKGYGWHEDSMPDLVSFLEKAGHQRVTYHVFPGDFWLRMQDRHAPNIGANLHTFEAGLIAGFIGSSRRHSASAAESTCALDGSGECMFSSSGAERRPAGRESIGRLVDHVSRAALAGKRKPEKKVPFAYYMLASGVLYDSAYIGAIKQVVAHVGAQIAQNTIRGRKSVGTAIRAIELLGMGSPRLKSISPIALDVRFADRYARRELTELSVAFISGLLNNLVAKNRMLEAATSHNRGTYTIRIREVRAARDK
ncbi:MAG: hypothetical protein KGH66_00290 [Candidatus Micrarchaeota archaeon]|nr:hypothetical protein [Candidatus Micrarchaeota archaeon]